MTIADRGRYDRRWTGRRGRRYARHAPGTLVSALIGPRSGSTAVRRGRRTQFAETPRESLEDRIDVREAARRRRDPANQARTPWAQAQAKLGL